jgi:hypothetical protein
MEILLTNFSKDHIENTGAKPLMKTEMAATIGIMAPAAKLGFSFNYTYGRKGAVNLRNPIRKITPNPSMKMLGISTIYSVKLTRPTKVRRCINTQSRCCAYRRRRRQTCSIRGPD